MTTAPIRPTDPAFRPLALSPALVVSCEALAVACSVLIGCASPEMSFDVDWFWVLEFVAAGNHEHRHRQGAQDPVGGAAQEDGAAPGRGGWNRSAGPRRPPSRGRSTASSMLRPWATTTSVFAATRTPDGSTGEAASTCLRRVLAGGLGRVGGSCRRRAPAGTPPAAGPSGSPPCRSRSRAASRPRPGCRGRS